MGTPFTVHGEGLGAALLASTLFNVGVVLQAIDARVAPRSLGLRVALLGRLFARPLWVLGLALGLVGAAPQALAYAHAPFVLVQPVLTLGLLIVLVLGVRLLHEPVAVREVAGVLAIVGGVALVAWGAPSHTEQHRSAPDVIAVFAGLSAAGLLPFAVRGTRLESGRLLMFSTGAAFSATNVGTKLLGDNFDLGHYGTAAAWGLAALALGAVATIVNMTAFQRCPATTVVPVSTAVQTFLPVVLEPFFLREHWSSASYDGVPLAAGLVLALAGVVLITASKAVSDLIAGAA